MSTAKRIRNVEPRDRQDEFLADALKWVERAREIVLDDPQGRDILSHPGAGERTRLGDLTRVGAAVILVDNPLATYAWEMAEAAWWRLAMTEVDLAYSIVRSGYASLTTDDMRQEALIGLYNAARTFEPSRGRFSTHVRVKLRSTMYRTVTDTARMVRVPDDYSAAARRVEHTGAGVDSEAIANNLSPATLRSAVGAVRGPKSISSPSGHGSSATLADTLQDDGPCMDDTIEHGQLLRIALDASDRVLAQTNPNEAAKVRRAMTEGDPLPRWFVSRVRLVVHSMMEGRK